MTEYEEFEKRVIEWIADWGGVSPDIVAPDMSINRGIAGLGVDGDDAKEMLQYLSCKTGVSFSDFEYDKFFGPEGIPFRLICAWITGNRRLRLDVVTPRDIARFMYDRLNASSLGCGAGGRK